MPFRDIYLSLGRWNNFKHTEKLKFRKKKGYFLTHLRVGCWHDTLLPQILYYVFPYILSRKSIQWYWPLLMLRPCSTLPVSGMLFLTKRSSSDLYSSQVLISSTLEEPQSLTLDPKPVTWRAAVLLLTRMPLLAVCCFRCPTASAGLFQSDTGFSQSGGSFQLSHYCRYSLW